MNRRIRLVERRIEIDGHPRLIFAGEVHYFRLRREEWEGRIRQLKESGLDTLATYTPWIWHELPDGSVDLTGETVPERDLAGFLDLCAREGVDVIARPGPFVMAELKNEGIPYRIRRQHPRLHPVGWDGVPAPTRTLDYLAPEFLAKAGEWYRQVMPVLAARQATRGGPVLGVQLDNEVGMLAWVSNSPDLTDVALDEFRGWYAGRVSDEELADRLGPGGYEQGDFAQAVRSGGADPLALHHDLGLFMRDRFARYLQHLEGVARELGIDVPVMVNVHGTGDGRGLTFPIGVSQLAPAYRGRDGVMAGSDYYLGELSVTNVGDLYLSNAILASVNGADQPSSSLEFEVGTGDYGEDLHQLTSPEAGTLKTLLSVAQGNRLINYYLFAGGRNPLIEVPETDGNGRIAFTGERHGFAAPIDPEGNQSSTYPGVATAVRELRALEPVLASAIEEYDDLAYGFVADHYLTEYRYPASSERADQVADFERHRGFGFRDVFARALVLGGFSFPAIDLQAVAAPDSDWAAGSSPEVDSGRAIALSTGRTLGRDVQQYLAGHVMGGGRLFLTGLLPDRDDDGTPCTVLANALGLSSAGVRVDSVTADSEYWPSVRGDGAFADTPEVRVGSAQLLAPTGSTSVESLLTEVGSGNAAAVLVRLGPGTAGPGAAVVIGCDYPLHFDTWRRFFALLDVHPRFTHDSRHPGLVITSVRDGAGTRVIFVLNVAPYAIDAQLRLHGDPMGERMSLPARGHSILTVPD